MLNALNLRIAKANLADLEAKEAAGHHVPSLIQIAYDDVAYWQRRVDLDVPDGTPLIGF